MDYKQSFQEHDDSRQPYGVIIERSSTLPHLHAHVCPQGYSIDCAGNRYLFAVPPVSTFTLCLQFSYTMLEEFHPCWMVLFGYDRRFRTGYALSFETNLGGGLSVELFRVNNIDFTPIGSPIVFQEFRVSDGPLYEAHIAVQDNNVSGEFAGHPFAFPLPDMPTGYVGVQRRNFIGALVLADAAIHTEEELETEAVSEPVQVSIPMRNGGNMPYRLEYQIIRRGSMYYLDYTFTGGTAFRDKIYNEQYSVEQDYFTNPYLILEAGSCTMKIYIKNGRLVLSDPGVVWECLQDFFGAEKLPISRQVYLDLLAFPTRFTITFGYECMEALGFELQKGASEFTFDETGALIYEGDPRCEDWFLVSSPEDKKAVSLIPPQTVEYDAVCAHFKKNHYFMQDESPSFTLTIGTDKSERYIRVEAELRDVFDTPIQPLSVTTLGELRYQTQTMPLPIGVYRIVFSVFYGDASLQEIVTVFEVFEPNGIAPAQASGLPFLYSTPNEQRWLDRDSFDPWNPKESCNMEHYFSSTAFIPWVAEKKRTWEITKLFGRKWFVWLESRTEEDWHYSRHLDIVKNADYIFYPAPYNNYPILNALPRESSYQNGLQDVFADFLEEHPQYTEGISYKRGEKFTKRHVDEIHALCMAPWYAYAQQRIYEQVQQQNRELCAINPQIKRSSYGPMTPYYKATTSYFQIRVCGSMWGDSLTQGLYSGFAQLEDYPFSCAYQTYRGAFSLMTIRLHCPGLTVYPEQYRSSYGGCIDGAVKFAYPPMAEMEIPAYFQLTHAMESVYNTPYFDRTGFHYWERRGFMKRDFDEAEMETFIKGWKQVVDHEPVRPLRSMAFLAEYTVKDDRYDPAYEWNYHNVSEQNQGYLYECARQSGIPGGFALAFEALNDLSAEDTDLLILPSLYYASQQQRDKIRKLHEQGVSLFAVGDVTGLEDLFGVCIGDGERRHISHLSYGEKEEYITPYQAELRYVSTQAEAVLTADDGVPVLLQHGNTALLNGPISEIGRDTFMERDMSARESVSRLLRMACTEQIRRLSSPIAQADGAGITLFRDEKGRLNLLVIDYSPHDQTVLHTRKNQVEVRFQQDYADATCVSGKEIIRLCEDGRLQGLMVTLAPQDYALIEITE